MTTKVTRIEDRETGHVEYVLDDGSEQLLGRRYDTRADAERALVDWGQLGHAGAHTDHHLRADDMGDVHCLECSCVLDDGEAGVAWPEDITPED